MASTRKEKRREESFLVTCSAAQPPRPCSWRGRPGMGANGKETFSQVGQFNQHVVGCLMNVIAESPRKSRTREHLRTFYWLRLVFLDRLGNSKCCQSLLSHSLLHIFPLLPLPPSAPPNTHFVHSRDILKSCFSTIIKFKKKITIIDSYPKVLCLLA